MNTQNTSKSGKQAKARSQLSGSIETNKRPLIPLLIILAVTLVCYLPARTNEFVNWDDFGYVVDNTLIREFSFKNLQTIFTTLQQQGNYHPLTMLTYNIEYQFFGQDPHGYHVMNIILHLINTGLVFWLLHLLSGRIDVPFIVGLLFGIHTLHVESVAWVSELKDLLYALFYFGSLICYLKYIKQGESKKLYVTALLLFVLSVLSKAMAVSLTAVLLLIDYFMGRKFDKRVLAEKVPFAAVSLSFGVIALFAQQAARAIHGNTQYSLLERVVFACYGFVTYLWKLIIPTKLSAFYPYPERIGGSLPMSIWIYPLIVVAIVAMTFYTIRYSRKVFFGMAFFFITIALVLQLLQVGGAVMADRYTYIPSIGLFYIIAEGYRRVTEKGAASPSMGKLVIVGFAGYMVWLSVLTWERAGIWHDSFSLWTDTVAKYDRIPFAFTNRGYAYYKIGKYDEAIADYNKTLQLDATDAGTYHNRGVAYYHSGKNELALADFNKAFELKLDNSEVYNNRGAVYAAMGRSDAAIADFTRAIELSPDYAEAYNNRGTEYAKARMLEAALTDFNKAIELKPDYTDAIRNRALASNDMTGQKPDSAAHGGSGSTETAEYYFNRGAQYGRTGNIVGAINDFATAIKLRPDYADAYNNRGIAQAMLLNYDASFADFNKAIQIKPDYGEAYFNRAIAHRNKGNKAEACADFKIASSLKFEAATKAYQEFCR